MDFRKREAVRKSRIFLLENVIFDILVDHLIDQDIFSESMLDNIRAGRERIENIRRMLDYLTKRPDSCYQRFLTALTNSGQEHCAQFIQERWVESGPTQVSDPTPVDNIPTPVQQSASGMPYDDDEPMESSSSSHSEKNLSGPAGSTASPGGIHSYGYPETTPSMQGQAGSFTSIPVQESSPAVHLMPAFPSSHHPVYAQGFEVEPPLTGPCAGTHQHSHQLSVYDRHFQSNPLNVYRMGSNPRGLALVINNENFKSMPSRPGSKKDMENLHLLFKMLGFDVNHQMDKTAQEIKALLKSFAQFEALGRVDALAVVILSHGGRDGVIHGTDGTHRNGQTVDYVTDENIRDIFSARNCPLMAQKPKLIIIQACRGKSEDTPDGVSTFSRPSADTSSLGQDGTSLTSNVSSASSSRVANMADMCLIHSTVHGYVSYRHPVQGSPFVQALTDVFKRKATHEHLMDMMAEVNQTLANRQLQMDLRTVPSTTNTLTKKWFFNPLHLGHESSV